ncbi:MAG: hypothetical protein A2Y76_00680 [Planctomycetes bacterium RBG_13_60_9]|nr:MAG: hypothetical protein A2Y76_00680 [Planctomycetes bacterium RBG_13_60_9]
MFVSSAPLMSMETVLTLAGFVSKELPLISQLLPATGSQTIISTMEWRILHNGFGSELVTTQPTQATTILNSL